MNTFEKVLCFTLGVTVGVAGTLAATSFSGKKETSNEDVLYNLFQEALVQGNLEHAKTLYYLINAQQELDVKLAKLNPIMRTAFKYAIESGHMDVARWIFDLAEFPKTDADSLEIAAAAT